MPNQYMTNWAQAQPDADGGFAASLASSHEQAANALRNLPDNLMAVPTDQYVFATKGTDEERRAAVDAWAAAHHVTAGYQRDRYCAKVLLGLIPCVAIAIPEKRAA